MAEITLQQGDVTANLSDVRYRGAEGFQEDNTWFVREESLEAMADTPLFSGPATIRRGQTQFEVTITVFEFESEPEQEEEIEDGEPVCSIEIKYADGLPKLALALGLLDHLTPKQQRAILGG